ncbi:hypothetical protein ACIOEX_01525 [Streptomyces sp. NPDC087850]|uniref:hypothetical protein n=1 Tax=Streptomyces sp. NPDC087850 TaxID=3365809 RepID=UPI00381BD6B8
MTTPSPAPDEPLTPELYAQIHGLSRPSARARLSAMFTPRSDVDQAEFERRVDAAVAEETAALRARIAELEKDAAFLSALEAAGVHNWEGYDNACEIANGG